MENWNREQIEQALEKVLSDDKFAAAPQMSAFLRCVVTQTLDGNADRIKAYTVAVDALGKPPTFDPQNDPSVRVLAKRLRDTLTHYYERTSGHELIIQIKCGSYVPKFAKPSEIEQELRANDVVTALTQKMDTSIEEIEIDEVRPSLEPQTEAEIYDINEELQKKAAVS